LRQNDPLRSGVHVFHFDPAKGLETKALPVEGDPILRDIEDFPHYILLTEGEIVVTAAGFLTEVVEFPYLVGFADARAGIQITEAAERLSVLNRVDFNIGESIGAGTEKHLTAVRREPLAYVVCMSDDHVERVEAEDVLGCDRAEAFQKKVRFHSVIPRAVKKE
jgi:hypothetical protein